MTYIKILMTLAAIIVVGVLVLKFMTTPDQRSDSERLGDAIEALPQGINKAERELQNRTPGEKLGNSIKDVGDKIIDNTQPSNDQ